MATRSACWHPTEILATSITFSLKLAKQIGYVAHFAYLIKHRQGRVAQELMQRLVQVVIGTHALLEKDVRFKKLAWFS